MKCHISCRYLGKKSNYVSLISQGWSASILKNRYLTMMSFQRLCSSRTVWRIPCLEFSIMHQHFQILEVTVWMLTIHFTQGRDRSCELYAKWGIPYCSRHFWEESESVLGAKSNQHAPHTYINTTRHNADSKLSMVHIQ